MRKTHCGKAHRRIGRLGGRRRPAVTRLRVAAAALASLWIVSCLPTAPPPEASSRSAVRPVLIRPSDRPRPNELTYRLGPIDQEQGRVRLDLEVTNGSARDFSAVSLTVVLSANDDLRKPTTRAVFVPVGSLPSARSRRVAVDATGVHFPVKSIEVYADSR